MSQVDPEKLKSIRETLDKKIVVFENTKDPQIQDDIRRADQAGFALIPMRSLWSLILSGFVYFQSAQPGRKSRNDDQRQSTPVPENIKNTAGQNEKYVLPTVIFAEDIPIQ